MTDDDVFAGAKADETQDLGNFELMGDGKGENEDE